MAKRHNIADYYNGLTQEERTKLSRKAGKASGKKRGERASVRESLFVLADMPIDNTKKLNPDDSASVLEYGHSNLNVSQKVAAVIAIKASAGDPFFVKLYLQLMGEDVAQKHEITMQENPFEELSVTELRKLAKADE